MKLEKILLILIGCLLSSSCSQKHVYLTPTIVGQLYDAETRKPISNAYGLLEFALRADEMERVQTDIKGSFVVNNFTLDYWLIPPSYSTYKHFQGDLYIRVSGYVPRFFSYYKFPYTEGTGGYSSPSKMNVGKIYLTPIQYAKDDSSEYENCPVIYGDEYCNNNYKINQFGVMLKNPSIDLQ
jgi:hypothetical protein